MKGTAQSTVICGEVVKIGDWLKVKYTEGGSMRGATIQGKVVEIWDPDIDGGHLQARLDCGWCFHDWDEIVERKDCD